MSSDDRSSAMQPAEPGSLSPVQAADVLVPLITYACERRYLADLDFHRLWVPKPSLPDRDANSRFIRITQVGYAQDRERSFGLGGIQNAFASMQGMGHMLVTAYAGDGSDVRMYVGVRGLGGPNQASTFDVGLQLANALRANLAGMEFALHDHEGDRLPLCLTSETREVIVGPTAEYRYAAALTGIPSLRDGSEALDQSIDRLLNSISDSRFLLLIMAEPVPLDAVYDALRRVHAIASDVHRYVRISESLGETLSTSDGYSVTHGTTETSTAGTSVGESDQHGEQAAKYRDAMLGLGGLASFVGAIGNVAGIATGNPLFMLAGSLVGGAASAASGVLGQMGTVSRTKGTTSSRFESTGTSTSESETASRTLTESQQRSIALDHLNKAAEASEKLLDGIAERLQAGKGLGMWRTGVYLLADDPTTLHLAGSQFRAIMGGDRSRLEPVRMLNVSPLLSKGLGSALAQLALPEVSAEAGAAAPLAHPLGGAFDGLATPLHTGELALTCNLPRREVRGVKLRPVAEFGVNPSRLPGGQASVRLGTLANVWTNAQRPIVIPLESLAGHVLVVGITGGGKTNTTKWLLQELRRNGVSFLVIEPAKREYASLARRPDLYGDVAVFTLGDETQNPLRLNPLEFVPGFPLLTHIDRLKSIFNAAFPMYAAMPYMLEEALLTVFTDRGWDLATSENLHVSDHEGAEWWEYLPTLEDLYAQIDRVVHSKGYAAEPTANYAAALKARISSLMVGSKGMMLNVRRGFPVENLLGGSAVVQFTGLGDDDEKCFAMGLLFNLLGEYREVTSREHEPSGLQHVCVVEEAHRLLRQTGSVDNPEVASPRAKAVETFANMLAEMRALGQGFVLADQIPSKLLSDAVKNTNLKIVHRLVAADDVGQMAAGMDLEDDQRRVIVKLPTGQAVVRAATDDSAFLVQVPRVDESGEPPGPPAEEASRPTDAPRWVVCDAVCTEPCRHYSHLANMRGETVDVAEEFIHRLAFGRLGEAASYWDWLRGEVRSRARVSATLGDGAITCLTVSDLQQAARRVADAYGGDWGHYDLLLRALRDVLAGVGKSDGQTADDAANPVTDALAAIGAGRPMVDAAACSGCRAVCLYGPLGRNVWRRLASTPGSRPGPKASAPMPSPEQLTAAIASSLPWLNDAHLQPLTYCVSIWMRVGTQQRTG